MKLRTMFGLLVTSAAALALSGCSIAEPIAFRVDGAMIDIAFCDSFQASSVEVDYGVYDSKLKSIALRSASGPSAIFGNGRPVSDSMGSWEFSSQSDAIPDEWERVDFSFFDENGEYVGGDNIFFDDVTSTDWTWQSGLNIAEPDCELDLG